MTRREQAAWAAGFFEGEGSFSRTGRVGAGLYCMVVTNTDLSMLERLASILDCGTIRPSGGVNRTVFRWKTTTIADADRCAALLYPYLSERRRAKIDELQQERGNVIELRLRPRACLGCGQPFTVNPHHGPSQLQKWCSPACGKRARRRLAA